MAVLTPTDKQTLRKMLSRYVPVNYTKAQADTAFQSIEDWMVNAYNVATPTSTIFNALNTALPGISNTQATYVLLAWCVWRADQYGVTK